MERKIAEIETASKVRNKGCASVRVERSVRVPGTLLASA